MDKILSFQKNRTQPKELFFNLKNLKNYPQEAFFQCDFYDCEFPVNLSQVQFKYCSFIDCIFKDLGIIVSQFDDCYFERCSFRDCTLTKPFFENNVFWDADLREAQSVVRDFDNNWMGELSCLYNARSSDLRCALNPNDSCYSCKDYASIFEQENLTTQPDSSEPLSFPGVEPRQLHVMAPLPKNPSHPPDAEPDYDKIPF